MKKNQRLKLLFFLFAACVFNMRAATFKEKKELNPKSDLLSEVKDVTLSITQFSVSGTVTDNFGIPLPGVNIVEKGTSNGAVSDFDGNFKLSVSDKNAVLVFSFIGFKAKEINLNNKTTINVSLEENAQAIDEVVVVGYAKTKKVNLTGSISTLKIDDVVSQPVSNTAQLLYGRVSGVQLEQNSGEPGSGSSLTVRGPNINNSNPLIVVDGIQVDNFNEISPSDIESFTILKDAASAAIYGSQGANGVILITTKSGKSGKLKMQLNSSIGIITPVALPELLRGADYARAMNEREVYEGSGAVLYSDDIISQIENGTANPDYFGNDDWFKALFGQGIYRDQYLSASGGTDKSTYLFSMRYNGQEGTLNGKSMAESYNVRAKIDTNVNDWLTIGVNMVGNYQKTLASGSDVEGGDGGIFRGVMQRNPLQPIRYTNGDYSAGQSFDGVNILPAGNQIFNVQNGDNIVDNFSINTQLYAKIKLMEGLSYEPAFVHRYRGIFEERFNPTFQLFDGPDRQNVSSEQNPNILFRNAGFSNSYQIDNLIRYNKNINEKHDFGLLLGHQLIVDDFKLNLFNVTVQNLASNDLRAINNGVASTLLSNGTGPTEKKLQSFFSRFEYRFDDKYLFEANFRIDGGSQFPPSSRYGYFPAFSAGWRISQEEFMSSTKDVISELKLRGSWGKLGSLNSLSLYPYQQTFGVGADYIFGENDSNLTDGAAVRALANSDLKWEETTTTDIGLDLTLYNKLSLTFDWYQRDTDDILLRLPIPVIVGDLTPPFVNAGEVSNKGWELSASYFNQIGKDFDFRVGMNISKNVNETIALPGIENGEIINGALLIREGLPLNSYYGLVFDGIYQTQEEIDAGPTPVDNGTVPGFRRYKDISGPDGVPDGRVDVNYDRAVIGNSFPKFVYGFNASMGYKGLDFAITFSGISDVDRLRPQNGNDPDQGNFLSTWKDRWSPTNPTNEFPVAGSDRQFSSWDIVDGSYLRLKLAELGYTLPQDITNKFGVDKLRFYVSGTNLLTFTDFTEGFDPEKAAGNRRGENYPLNKSLVLGLNLSF